MSENNISVERDFVGTLHIKVGDFDYVQIQYQHPFTDNASTRALADRIVAFLAQPAEAEGVRDYLTEFAEGEVEAKTAIEELQDALSAVTAERDRLREQVAALQSGANSWQSGYDKGREDGAKSAGGWKDQHARDSAELRRLCAERDQLRQHKNDYMDAAEGTRKALLAEVETLRKDADRFRHIERDCDSGMSRIYGDNWIAVIDEHIATEAALAAKEA